VRDRHVAPNAIVPALSRFITSVPYLLTGLIIIERELRLGSTPTAAGGIASLFFEAIESGDVPVILGILLMVGAIGMALRIALDVAQMVMDPRIRSGAKP
jgi:ABC-type dipeptide/oligopeptide/nickel transport system permease component